MRSILNSEQKSSRMSLLTAEKILDALISSAPLKCAQGQGHPKLGRSCAGATPFSLQKCELLQEAWWSITKQCSYQVRARGWRRGEEAGWCGATFSWRGASCISAATREHSVELSCVNRPRCPVCGAVTSRCRDSGVQGKGLGRGSEDLGVRLSSRTRRLISLNHYFHNWKNKNRNHALALPRRYAGWFKETGPEEP